MASLSDLFKIREALEAVQAYLMNEDQTRAARDMVSVHWSPLTGKVMVALSRLSGLIHDEERPSPLNEALVEIFTPSATDPNADEIIPPKQPGESGAGVFFQDKIDMVKQQEWKYRGRRNVLMDIGDGRSALVWAKGAAIPDEEAKRQGVEFYLEVCDRCYGVGLLGGADDEKALCPDCKGTGKRTMRAPWAKETTDA